MFLKRGPSLPQEWSEFTWSEFASKVVRVYFKSGPSLLQKWSEFTSKVVRVYLKSGPSLLQKWSEFTWFDFT